MIRLELWVFGRKIMEEKCSSHYIPRGLDICMTSFLISVLITWWGGVCSVQFSSVAKSCLTLCDPMGHSTRGLPFHHQLTELTQTHVHWVSDATKKSHPLSSTSLSFNLSQYQGLFKWVSSSYQVAWVSELQLQHQSFQWIFRIDFFKDGLVGF